jgi:hypothetical protein
MQELLSVGNVVSATCLITLRTTNAIAPSAAVVVEMRLTDGTTPSEWLPAGTYYIARRYRDPSGALLTLECYDALLKANAVWTPSAGSWPRSMSSVVAELATLLGLTQDSRNTLAAYTMTEPEAGTTIRDALSAIGAANGGSWIVSPAGLLRLVPLRDAATAAAASDAAVVQGVLKDLSYDASTTVTGLRYSVDGAPTLLGTDTGAVIDMGENGTQAQSLYDVVVGMTYQGYSLAGAIYDPAAELGDGLAAGARGEIRSLLCAESITLGPLVRGDVSAPATGGVVDEYPYIGGAANKMLIAAKAYANEVASDLDTSLDQQTIFNRLTNNGTAQGMYLSNGQLYVNASYIHSGTLTLGGANNVDGVLEVYDSNGTKVGYWDNTGIHVVNGEISANALKGGIIDGDYVSAKQLNILNDSNGIIAKFDDKIILGDCVFDKPVVYFGTRVEIEDEGIRLFAPSNQEIFAAAIAEGGTTVDTFVTVSTGQSYTLSKKGDATIISITVNGESGWEYRKNKKPPGVGALPDIITVFKYDISENSNIVNDGESVEEQITEGDEIYPETDDIVQITYTTSYPMYYYTLGQRTSNSNPGYWSICCGENCYADGNYSYTQGRNLISNGRSQHVFGEYNVADTTNTNANIRGAYVEIVGNGLSGNNRSNARTLDWSGNEWIAGALSVGDAATTLANLGAQTDVGFYIDAQGYICQRISSD